MRFAAVLLSFLLSTTALTAQILTTEVWVGDLTVHEGRLEISNLRNVSEKPGYDNQPVFLPGGERLLHTTQEGDLSDSGLGVHPVLVDLRTGGRTPFSAARGFSPTPVGATGQFMTLREGAVWLHDATGRPAGKLTETSTAGYFTRFDERTWVLFMNEPERRIVLYDARTRRTETMAKGATTAPYRVPGARAVTFVAEEPFPADEDRDGKAPTHVLRRLDLRTKQVRTLAKIPFPSGGHHVWTSRGTLLIASGAQIYEWSPEEPEVWRPVYQASHPDLQGITRIALSDAGDRIALVSVPRAETMIRESRAASNRALGERKADAVAAFLAGDALVITARGLRLEGREAVAAALREQFESFGDTVYLRTPDAIEISETADVASESGTWSGTWTTPEGQIGAGGRYMAAWRRSIGATGVPSWAIATELFVPLSCEGSGCEAW